MCMSGIQWNPGESNWDREDAVSTMCQSGVVTKQEGTDTESAMDGSERDQ